MKANSSDHGISDSTTTSYYKLEKRNDRYKVIIVVEGISSKSMTSYAYCTVIKKNSQYWVKEVRTLLINNGKINESIALNEAEALQMVGAIVISKSNTKSVNYIRDTVLIGYQEESFNLEELKSDKDPVLEKTISLNNSDDRIIGEKGTHEIEQKVEKGIPKDIHGDKENKYGVGKLNSNKEFEQEVNIEKQEEKNEKTQKEKINLFETLHTIKKDMEKSEIEEFLEDIFRTNQKMQPFENEDPSVEWIKIEITDLVFLPIESWIYINNAFLMNCYRKYKHLLLGRKKGDNIITLGVPDIYFFKSSIVANLCGFFEFTSCKNALPKAGEYGYWKVKTYVK